MPEISPGMSIPVFSPKPPSGRHHITIFGHVWRSAVSS